MKPGASARTVGAVQTLADVVVVVVVLALASREAVVDQVSKRPPLLYLGLLKRLYFTCYIHICALLAYYPPRERTVFAVASRYAQVFLRALMFAMQI